jgi:hypothetical protein
MSEFSGSTSKVRCVDCTRLQGNICSAKKVKVAPKKRRSCGSYSFSGEYENRTSLDSMYIPYVDKKTKKLFRKLSELGIIPVSAEEEANLTPEERTIIVPFSTAARQEISHPSEEIEEVSIQTPYVPNKPIV